MFFSLTKKQRTLPGVNYLELTPARKLQEETDENQQVKILIPKFKKKWMLDLIPRHRSPYIRLNLDELGSATWLSIDGQKKVSEIVNELSERFGEKIQPADERIIKFLTSLYQNKFIIFNELITKKNG